MTLWRLFLRFAPYIAAALLILAVWMFWANLSARFPWSAESRARHAEAAAAHATLDASARSLEVTGQADQAARVDTYSHIVITTQTAAAQAMAEARSAPDAAQPINSDRLDRLHSVIVSLCRSAPQTCDPAPAANPGGSDAALPPHGPAG